MCNITIPEPPWRETVQIVANVTGNTERVYVRDAILKKGHAKIFTLLLYNEPV